MGSYVPNTPRGVLGILLFFFGCLCSADVTLVRSGPVGRSGSGRSSSGLGPVGPVLVGLVPVGLVLVGPVPVGPVLASPD